MKKAISIILILSMTFTPLAGAFTSTTVAHADSSEDCSSINNDSAYADCCLDNDTPSDACQTYSANQTANENSQQCFTNLSITSDAMYEAQCTGQADEDSAACNAYAACDDGGDSQCASILNDTTYDNCCNGDSGDSAVCVAYNTSSAADANNSPSAAVRAGSTAAQARAASISSGSPTVRVGSGLVGGTTPQFQPNANISTGNTYSGVSISGVGGAIASCLNVGNFLVGAASSLLGGIIGGSSGGSGSASSYVGGGDQAVSTSDSATQKKLDTANNTTDCLDGVAYALAKSALAQITNKTLNWVNTGFNGNPLYVQNSTSYLNSIQNQQITSFLGTVQKSDPIFGNAIRSALTQQITGKSDGLLSTPLNTPQATAYSSFQTDFTNGGWDALLNPANNPVGALFTASDTLSSNINTQQSQAQNEIQRNNGFLDMKTCKQYANNGQVSSTTTTQPQCSTISDDTTYETCCTGQSADDSVACQQYALSDDGGDPQCANITDDTIYNNCCNTNADDSAVCVAYNTSSAADANGVSPSTTTYTNTSTKSGAGLVNQPVCTQWATTTPGSVIASQVKSVTNTPVQQLVYANKINEVLGSFFDSFVNNLLAKGLRGSGTAAASSSDQGYGSEGDNYIQDSTGLSASSLGYQASESGDVDTGDFDISRPQQLYAIIQAQYNFLNRAQDAKIALDRIVPAVGALDYCIPGPNPQWQDGLDSNWQTFESSLQQAAVNPTSTPEQILGSLPIIGGFVGTIASLFTGSGKSPTLWSATGPLLDGVTGTELQVQRIFFTPKDHGDDIQTSDVLSSLTAAYQTIVNYYNGYEYPAQDGSFDTVPVGAAFIQAAPSDPSVNITEFLQDAYSETSNLVSYNQTASSIDQQYNQEISATNNTIQQLETIRQKVNAIVATAKARYISQNPGVNIQCLDQAYVIDNSPITGVAPEEPNTTPIDVEEDAMVQHSQLSASDFYSQVK